MIVRMSAVRRGASSRALALPSMLCGGSRCYSNFSENPTVPSQEHDKSEPVFAERVHQVAAPVTLAFGRAPEDSPVLTLETQKLHRDISQHLGYSFVSYWNSPNGSICQGDIMALARILANWPRNDEKDKKLGLFLRTDGGDPEAALRLMHLLRGTFTHINVFAPYNCASSGTLVCLGANEIHMGSTSFLSAVDTSLVHSLGPVSHEGQRVSISQDQVSRILKLWQMVEGRRTRLPGDKEPPPTPKPVEVAEHHPAGHHEDHHLLTNPYQQLYRYIHPIVIGELDRSSSLSVRICKEMLSFHMDDEEKAAEIARVLNYEYPSHSYPITRREAARIGLKVKNMDHDLETMLYRLNAMYSTMGQYLRTDYDADTWHKNEILNIVESSGKQAFYKIDVDFRWRREEKKSLPLNDKSKWKLATVDAAHPTKVAVEDLHLR